MNLPILVGLLQLEEEMLFEPSAVRLTFPLVLRWPGPETVPMAESTDAIQGEEAGREAGHFHVPN